VGKGGRAGVWSVVDQVPTGTENFLRPTAPLPARLRRRLWAPPFLAIQPPPKPFRGVVASSRDPKSRVSTEASLFAGPLRLPPNLWKASACTAHPFKGLEGHHHSPGIRNANSGSVL